MKSFLTIVAGLLCCSTTGCGLVRDTVVDYSRGAKAIVYGREAVYDDLMNDADRWQAIQREHQAKRQ